jgi:hypothetical protein
MLYDDIPTLVLFYYLFMLNSQSYINNQINDLYKSKIFNNLIILFTVYIVYIFINKHNNNKILINCALLTTFWIILAKKMDLPIFIILMIILFCIYVYNNQQKQYIEQIKNDKMLPNKMKDEYINNYNDMKIYITATGVLITILGIVLYYLKKCDQYTDQFDMITFIIK